MIVDAFPYVLGRPFHKFYLVNMIKYIARRQESIKEKPIEETKYQVLVADDNYLCRNAVVSLLRKHVSKISSCANGKQALDMLIAKHYDIAIIDYQMPEMGGLETIKNLREYERTHSILKSTFIVCIFP